MAQASTHVTGQASQPAPKQHGTGETVGTGIKDRAEPNLKQEPGDSPAEDTGRCVAEQRGQSPSSHSDKESASKSCKTASHKLEPDQKLTEPSRDLTGGSSLSSTDCSQDCWVLKREQRKNVSTEDGIRRQASLELTAADADSLSRMDSEDSSTIMDLESTASSGRSTPALLNGHSGAMAAVSSSAPAVGKSLSYTCCWDHCQLLFSNSPDLAEHIRATHVDGQREGVFVCLWKGCKVYNTPSTSHSWLQRHILTHSGDKPFKCVVGGCHATFASQGGLARHVPTHFSSQSSSKMSSQGKLKEESPSKAGLNKRRKLRNKYRRSLPRPHDFFDAQTMEAIRHRAICLNLVTHIESLGNGHSVVFHSTVVARRKENSGKVKVLLHWTPEDILPDVWVNESDRLQLKTKVVHLSQLPTDTSVLMDPNVHRMFF
ncbi:zinc finger protein AEBP2 [Nothobranchius furzeri]|uniref:AE binding protein 2 n=3 Tax=Nothobranchius furzeri TaxID=105023 RepID=A0A8C6M2I4_NOTFU|nr:AE binding protein 2 [Nothobranchius furzeri]